MREHDLAEFELEREGLKLRVRKAQPTHPPMPVMIPRRCRLRRRCLTNRARRLHRRWPRREPGGRRRGRARARGREVADRRHLLSIARTRRRPRSSRSAPAVKKDQVLCIIEAMKLMNEIKSEYDGEIVSVYVENGKPVQYGERLFAIKTPLTERRRHVQEDPDRQSRRDRAARHLRVPRARDQDRRGLLGGRRELAARPLRRRGRLHRPGAQRRQLPERPGDPQRRRDHRRRRHPSRLRVPVRERVPRRGLRGLPHQVHRPGAERHPPARRQGAGAPRDEEGRRADPARQRWSGRERGQGARRSRASSASR